MYRTESPMYLETGSISTGVMTVSGGAHFCLNDYVCYSADVADLTDWRYEGVIYRKEQDPRNQNIPKDAPELRLDPGIVPQGSEDLNPRGIHAMWAPMWYRGRTEDTISTIVWIFCRRSGRRCAIPRRDSMNFSGWCAIRTEHLWE